MDASPLHVADNDFGTEDLHASMPSLCREKGGSTTQRRSLVCGCGQGSQFDYRKACALHNPDTFAVVGSRKTGRRADTPPPPAAVVLLPTALLRAPLFPAPLPEAHVLIEEDPVYSILVLPGARGEVPLFLSTAYSYLVHAEGGPATFFAKRHSTLIKTTGKDSVWTYDAFERRPLCLWVPRTLEQLSQHMGIWLMNEVKPVLEYARNMAADLKAEGNKEEAKPWGAAVNALIKAARDFATERTLTSIAKAAFSLLRDPDFESKINAKKGWMPFENGNVDMRTGELHTRVRTDYITYTLPFDYDPHASTADIKSLIQKLYEDFTSENAFQCLAGYWATGEASIKAFWQVAAPSNSGKTELFTILCDALGRFAARGEVPIGELTDSKFEDGLWSVLSRQPPPRLVVTDEVGGDVVFKEPVINGLTDGTARQKMTFNLKGVGPSHLTGNHDACYAILTNHVLRIPASATGMVRRNHAIGLQYTFGDARVHPMDRLRDAVLVARLKLPEAWPGILRWLVQGAQSFYALGERVTTCKRFDAASFDLQLRGDPYLAWLASTYSPTGLRDDKITLDELVRDFKTAAREPAANARAFDGLKDLLESMRDYIEPSTWSYLGMEAQGYIGLRPRRMHDFPWAQARYSAMEIALERRRAEENM